MSASEIDHPANESVKRQVLEHQLGALPPQVSYVAVDFDSGPLAPAVAKAELQPGRRTFTIWEGVASYLTPERVDTTVRWTSDVAGPGSELVFTYVNRDFIARTGTFPTPTRGSAPVAPTGEPFVFGFRPDDLVQYLGVRGWKLVHDLATPEALALYGLSAARVPSFYRMAAIRSQQAS